MSVAVTGEPRQRRSRRPIRVGGSRGSRWNLSRQLKRHRLARRQDARLHDIRRRIETGPGREVGARDVGQALGREGVHHAQVGGVRWSCIGRRDAVGDRTPGDDGTVDVVGLLEIRSSVGLSVSVSVAVLFPGLTSVNPGGGGDRRRIGQSPAGRRLDGGHHGVRHESAGWDVHRI